MSWMILAAQRHLDALSLLARILAFKAVQELTGLLLLANTMPPLGLCCDLGVDSVKFSSSPSSLQEFSDVIRPILALMATCIWSGLYIAWIGSTLAVLCKFFGTWITQCLRPSV
ncbi:hypothetical protein OE88DRAFT_823329 [Heliocybe sulcata]|uniref:Uncharacterized protein n=1 Tax=Heliocybe sulcata TaxID=5364 RepID=A0A5C3MQR2_9AGAM|nr:hypothetical protein OE88DRAFT_823329 [Heliocybe sulcata]